MNLMKYVCDCTCAPVDWLKNVGHGPALKSHSNFTVTQSRAWLLMVFSWMSILLLFQIAKGALLSRHV